MICLTGLPLAGKTTIALKIVKEFNFTYISTGDIVRGMGGLRKDFTDLQHMKKRGYSLKYDDYIIQIVKSAPYRSIIDGFPRNMRQAVLLPNVPIIVLLVEHMNILKARAHARGRDELDGYWFERVKSFDRFMDKLSRSRSLLVTTSQEKAYEYLKILAQEHREDGGTLPKL